MTISIIPALESLVPCTCWRIEGEPTYANLEWFDEETAKPEEAVLMAEAQRLAALRPWNELRAERDRLLAETDWVVARAIDASNDGLGIQLEQVWVQYRQALRDLPANTVDPANPVWPVKPQ